MANIWGLEPRSTYHKTCVRRVNSYLKQKCSESGYERELVAGYKTDAFGYNRKSKIWYLCEIKVDPSDLKKAPQQILDTKFHFPQIRHYHTGDTIVPVIVIPAKLANYLVKINEWGSLRKTCRMVKVAIWVIEQSTVREVMSPKTKAVKTKSTGTKAVKTNRPKTTKTRTTRTKTIVKPKKSSVKSSTVKKTKTQSTKRKTSRVSVAKTRVARGKRKAD